MATCIPIHTTAASGLPAGGTGFLTMYRDRTWLVTAAHVALGSNPAHGRWEEWPRHLTILLPAGGAVNFELFRDTGGPFPSRFAFLGDRGQIADVLALPLPQPVVDTGLFREFQIFDLKQASGVATDDRIWIVGHPTDVNSWPEIPAARLAREVVGLEDQIIQYLPKGAEGTSGGPVLTERGELVGVTIGHNHGVGRAITVDAVRVLLDANLEQRPGFPDAV